MAVAEEEKPLTDEEKKKFWGKRLVDIEEVKAKEELTVAEICASFGAAASEGDDAALKALKGLCVEGYSLPCMTLDMIKKDLTKKGVELPKELEQDYWKEQRELRFKEVGIVLPKPKEEKKK